MVSSNVLKEVTSLLIDIHGQHEHESLLHKSKHLVLLDSYGESKIAPLKTEYQKLYERYIELEKEEKEFEIDEDQRNKELDFLSFQINEINEADLKEDEDVFLEEEYKRISNANKIMHSLNQINETIEGRANYSFLDEIGQCIKDIQKISNLDNKLEVVQNYLVDLESISNDLVREISQYMDDISFDEEKMDNISKRLDLINRFKIKYGNSITQIISNLEGLEERYEFLLNMEEEIAKIRKEKDEIRLELKSIAKMLTNERKNAALSFQKDIENSLLELNFLQVRFGIDFKELNDFSYNGCDKIEFMISLNPGEELKPLAKVSSGGELSRIMLSLKSIFAGKDGIGTLIFDEIDTGISGRTAQKVSERLKDLSKTHQIIAITHLPQIAAMSDAHYVIEKNVRSSMTYTEVKRLSEEESINEIARMLGGVTITQAVIENAKEMKSLAKNDFR
jgi:DNA repair protein RecN (Recombination protein N)